MSNQEQHADCMSDLAEKLNRGETIKARRVDGTTSTSTRENYVAKKRAKKTVAEKREIIESIDAETEADRFQVRMSARIADLGGSVQRAFNFVALLAFIEAIMEICADINPSRFARRVARARVRARSRMTKQYREHMGNDISWDDAESIVDAIKADAQADRKGMERLFEESRKPMEW